MYNILLKQKNLGLGLTIASIDLSMQSSCSVALFPGAQKIGVTINFSESITKFIVLAQTVCTRHSLWFFEHLGVRLSSVWISTCKLNLVCVWSILSNILPDFLYH